MMRCQHEKMREAKEKKVAILLLKKIFSYNILYHEEIQEKDWQELMFLFFSVCFMRANSRFIKAKVMRQIDEYKSGISEKCNF